MRGFVVSLFCHSCRIADHSRARRDLTGDYAACAYDGIVTYPNAGEKDHAPANPHIGADGYRLAAFKSLPPQSRIAGMVGCEYLHARAQLASVTHLDCDNIE